MNKIDYDVDRNFGKNWSGGNSDKEYHLISPTEYDHFSKVREANTIGELSNRTSTSLGLEVDVGEIALKRNPFGLAISKLLHQIGAQLTGSFGMYGLVDNLTKQTGHRICGEISIGRSTKDIPLNKVEKKFAAMISNLMMVKFDDKQEGGVSNAVSLEGKASASINTKPLSKAGEVSLKLDSSNGTKTDRNFNASLSDKIGIAGNISIRGCMTFKDTGRYDISYMPLDDEF